MNPELEKLQTQKDKVERQIAQCEHRETLLQNRIAYAVLGYQNQILKPQNQQAKSTLPRRETYMNISSTYDVIDLNTPFWDYEQPSRTTLREFEKYWDQYWKEREKQYTDMDKAFYAVDEDGQEYFYIGKNRIKITEHFPEKGKTMGELIEDLILYAARQEKRANKTDT